MLSQIIEDPQIIEEFIHLAISEKGERHGNCGNPRTIVASYSHRKIFLLIERIAFKIIDNNDNN